ncbi:MULTISPECIES: muconolactone Delta-isomerase family protein [Streptomyces]|uniref:muconolactone Delta-isomerase n=1 Tax=Streptomyces TaxID=1883 RepID=UPI002F908312|nr:muconolactone Delta-isomerase family protein [Streptomyces chartreusis]WTA33501.1 muconolactone Delta-isomerase family protein [Streptomyces chartreusis]
MPREFLVHIVLNVPSSVSPKELAVLRTREKEAAASLAARGHLVRIWRVPGEWANWGLWRAKDESELNALLNTLPLRPYMKVDLHPTEPHPSDPAT